MMKEEEIANHIRNKRREFSDTPLLERDLISDPYGQFASWMKESVEAELLDPYAMCLSTVDANMDADSRIVYLRDITQEGFIFYTNYESEKAKQIFNNSSVTLNFLWNELSRQVKIKGRGRKASEDLSNEYFSKRPRASQIGAWASNQSRELSNREELEEQLKDVEDRFKGKEVPRPPHWGGILVEPTYFEFWKGRVSRLHDRLVYIKEGKSWRIKRLSP